MLMLHSKNKQHQIWHCQSSGQTKIFSSNTIDKLEIVRVSNGGPVNFCFYAQHNSDVFSFRQRNNAQVHYCYIFFSDVMTRSKICARAHRYIVYICTDKLTISDSSDD